MHHFVVLIYSMIKDYEWLFSQLAASEPPKDFLCKIMLRIDQEKRLRVARRRFAFFIFVLIASAGAAVPALQAVQASFTELGFMQIFSLLFSDSQIIIAYLDNFAIALLESIPVISIALFLTTIFIFLNSLKYAARDFKTILSSTAIKP